MIAPYNLPMPRYGDIYDQACRSMNVTPEGFVGNMNRFFGEKWQPEEVAILQHFTDTVHPGLVLDLHEGYGRGFYIYVNEERTPIMDEIADSMVAAVKAHGGATGTIEELTPYWGSISEGRTMVRDGLLYAGPSVASSFGTYWEKKGVPAFTQETGGLNPLSWRTDLQEWSARAAVDTFTKSYE